MLRIKNLVSPASLPGGLRIGRFQIVAARGHGDTACQLIFVAEQSHGHQDSPASPSGIGELLVGAKTALITIPAGMREDEVGGRGGVFGNCIQHGLPNSSRIIPYSFRKVARSIIVQETQNRVVEPVIVDDFRRGQALQLPCDCQFSNARKTDQQNKDAHHPMPSDAEGSRGAQNRRYTECCNEHLWRSAEESAFPNGEQRLTPAPALLSLASELRCRQG